MKIFAGVLVVVGLAAFLMPLQHPGPYGIPGRGLWGGLLCFAIAGTCWIDTVPALVRRLGLIASPVALFIAGYGALAELEEVIVLYAPNAELRLWVVDQQGEEWIAMPRAKAAENALDGARLERLRAGEVRCTVPRLVDEAEAHRRTFELRNEKYAMQRFAQSLGIFANEPNPDSVSLRLDACD